MDHQLIYNTIIQKAKIENRVKLRKNQINYHYYESHHILPKCLGGKDDKDNLVLLTAREHYICHKLLTYIYKENPKIICAFHYMTYSKNYNKTSRDYAYARELWIKNMKGNIPWNKGNLTKSETKEKQSISHIGKFHTIESKNKIKESVKGNKNGMYKKDGWGPVRDVKKICEHCKKKLDPGNFKKWHGDKCKLNLSL